MTTENSTPPTGGSREAHKQPSHATPPGIGTPSTTTVPSSTRRTTTSKKRETKTPDKTPTKTPAKTSDKTPVRKPTGPSYGSQPNTEPLYINLPTNNVSMMMRSPYNLTLQQAQTLYKRYPNGYTLSTSEGGKGVTGMPVTSDTTFKDALDKMRVDFSAAGADGAQAWANILTSWGIPLKGKSSAINDSRNNAWSLIQAAGLDPAKVPTSAWGTGGIIITNSTAKAIKTLSSSEVQAILGQQANQNQLTLGRQQIASNYHSSIIAAVKGSTVYEQENAIDNTMNYLDGWGLNTPEMEKMVQNWVTGDGIINQGAVLNMVRQTKSYAQAFPGLIERNTKLGPGGEHMTETQYQSYVGTMENLMGQYGLPRNFLSKGEIGQMIADNVAPTEAEARIAKGYLAYKSADPQTKAILQKEYGMGPNLGAAYFMNPNRAQGAMERNIAQATIQGYAGEAGLHGFNKADAADLFGKMRLTGVTNMNGALADPYSTYTMAQAKNDLLTAAKNQPLTVANPGAGTPTVNTRALLGAQISGFGGTNQVAAQTAVERAAQGKAAPFEKGGGPEMTNKGVIGAGSAST